MKKRILNFFIELLMIVNMLLDIPSFNVNADEGYLWPVQGTQQINQYYSSTHDGIDIGGTLDTPILATMSGTVVAVIDGDVANKWVGYGKGVVIQHSNGYYSHYAHMNYTSVSINQYVSQGQQIGGMGTTGNSTGVHLHFSVAKSMYGAGGRINVNPDVIGYVYTIDPPHVHSFTGIITKQPTCTETGVQTYTCVCGDSKTESIPATGHKYLVEEVDPTTKSEGYSIYTCEVCEDSYKGNIIPQIVIGEDGWYYTQKLPKDVSDADYEIQYQHTYQTKAVSSPGDDWVKGELAETVYENVGDPFTTAKQVETSDTLIMTDFYYYHFCGPSAGNEANYEQTDKFSHYDYIYPEYSVVVQSTGMDGEYPYFVLGWANDNNTVFCASGTTCDGSYGSHGTRSKAWYRMASYQNRELVYYYNYTKQSSWETEKNSTASNIAYRYRTKESVVKGDINADGKFNIADAVTLQKWLLSEPENGLKCWQNGDFCADSVLDVFDLCAMKKELIKQAE